MGDDGGGGARDTRANHDTAACNLGRRFDFHKYTCSHQGAAGGDSHSIDYEDVVGGAREIRMDDATCGKSIVRSFSAFNDNIPIVFHMHLSKKLLNISD